MLAVIHSPPQRLPASPSEVIPFKLLNRGCCSYMELSELFLPPLEILTAISDRMVRLTPTTLQAQPSVCLCVCGIVLSSYPTLDVDAALA